VNEHGKAINRNRRSNGTGSIRQRGETFTAYWWTLDGSGKRKQQSKGGFAIRGSAQVHLNNMLSKVQNGEWRPDQPLTVRQLLKEHWLPSQISRNRRPATISQYRFVVDKWIVPHVGDHRASTLTPGHVQRLVDTLSTSKTAGGHNGLSARSLQLVVGTLKTAYKFAVESELLSRNPIASVRRPNLQHQSMKAWSETQARQFLVDTRDDELAAAWALLLTRGLRRGELCGLRWEAIDLDAGTAIINHTLVVVDGRMQESTPKTPSSRRSLPLDASLVSLLKGHRKRQREDRLRAGNAWTETDYVFADRLGRPYSPEVVSDRFDRLVKTSSLPRIRLHDTRHTAASLMLASGVSVKVVQEMLGHSSPAITLAIYAHTTPSMAKEAGAALSAKLLD
jgi:integrase